MEFSDRVKRDLRILVSSWADEVLPGRPALLEHAVYASMEQELARKQAEIEKEFPLDNSNISEE